MPVSPRDFELYSRMTGTPMPSDAMSRMQMAPEVFEFTKNFARKPNLLEKTGNLVKNIGKSAVMAIGAPMVAESMAEQARIQEQLRNQSDKTKSEAATTSDPVQASEELQIEQEKTKRKSIEMEGRKDLARMANSGVQKIDLSQALPDYYQSLIDGTTADYYGQDFVPNQTSSNIVNRKIEQGSQVVDENPNVAEVLSEFQDSRPSGFTDPVQVESQMRSGMEGSALGKNDLNKFMSQKGLDQALLGAIGERISAEPRIGDSSPLLDHPDIVGGEDDNNLPGIVNKQTRDINNFHREMRKLDAMERNKNVIDQIVNEAPTPSEMQVGRSPNVLAGKDQSTFEAIQAGIPQEERDAARMRLKEKTAKKRMARDNFMAQFVEGARSDIVRGQRGNQSLGITRIPATNGDSQVGFVLANRPIDQSPTKATTYGFGVAPRAEDIIQGSLDASTFDTYMDRGMEEAKPGKKRKAGEIFEFLSPKARIVQGQADLGDIIM
tara:strand:- start:193 stop:1674 length:1482 start_codon:yes stop_codon:yes gene_type:complete